MDYIDESQRKTELIGQYDTAVIGGGIAGVSAALAAARNGAKTVLLEREFSLGGLATLGLVTIFLPLCDGKGRQVSYGICEELIRLSIKYGYEPTVDYENRNPDEWINNTLKEKKGRFESQYNASLYAILLEQLLIESGVKIIYGCQICDAVVEGKRISAVIAELKEGRRAISAKNFVDCSGDADVCERSGAKTALFKQGNILASWYYLHSGSDYRLRMLGFADTPDKYKKVKEIDANKRYKGITSDEITDMMVSAHASVKNDFLKNGGITAVHAISSIASIPQIRMSRRICGEYTMNDTESHKHFSDSIGMIGDWRKAGPVYEIPFRTLYGKEIKNLITAGRCISVTDDMWDITRVIPACAVTGEAAGTAAAITDDFANIDISELQKKLVRNGVILHESDL